MLTNIISATAMLAVAVAAIAIARWRLGPVWRALLVGAALWVLTVGLKFAWAIPVNPPVYHALHAALGPLAGDVVAALYVGLLTGVFECGVLYALARAVPALNRTSSDQALALGTGFGAIEALVIGLSALAAPLLLTIWPDLLPPEQARLVPEIGWASVPIASVERALTILIHIFTVYAVVYAAKAGEMRWFWHAFWLKSGLDAVAAWAQFRLDLADPAQVWPVEAIISLFAAASVYGTMRLRKRWQERL